MSAARKKGRGQKPPSAPPSSPPVPSTPPERQDFLLWLWRGLTGPKPVVRLEFIRIFLPLAILAFMSQRFIHADVWVGTAGFNLPEVDDSVRQPAFLPRLSPSLAWAFAVTMVVSGLSTSLGFLTRVMAPIFAFTLVWAALSDRLSAFTVSKLGSVLVIGLALTPTGSAYSVDAWLRRRRDPSYQPPTHVPGAALSFFRLTLVVMYVSSGICKGRGDWLTTDNVIWNHLNDSYETAFSLFLANNLPAFAWPILQHTAFVFEAFAVIWFLWPRSRTAAVIYGLMMHALIGLMFGPVIWFSCLMATLLIGGFAPERWFFFARPRPPRPEPPASVVHAS